ncbi:hypothetical protein [Vibrio vulnificus]|uniref:hypothetical protein n=1 Tax=Vibrio vulnificus TaxID=672 RepID=UPI0009B5F7C7|nr:hypothetical protein [Vibrio vulnificus]OQK43887.1 putative membrane protein [Vibrio vulnificus]OQK55887.1 putative membrane protein [Vibrio vulnificus]POC19385.1 hypothetical protein CRN46_18635 [Vibrio vulnificus]
MIKFLLKLSITLIIINLFLAMFDVTIQTSLIYKMHVVLASIFGLTLFFALLHLINKLEEHAEKLNSGSQGLVSSISHLEARVEKLSNQYVIVSAQPNNEDVAVTEGATRERASQASVEKKPIWELINDKKVQS